MNANKFELMYANVAQGQRDLQFAHLDEVIKYMETHTWVTVKELGIALFGERYLDKCHQGSYASRLGAIMGKLIRNQYAECKQFETEGESFEIEKTEIQKAYLFTDEDFFTYIKEGWQITAYKNNCNPYINGQRAKGLAYRKIKIKKIVKPTIKMYRLFW